MKMTYPLLKSTDFQEIGKFAFVISFFHISVDNSNVLWQGLLSVWLAIQHLNRTSKAILITILLLVAIYNVHSSVVASHLVAVQDNRLVKSRGHRRNERHFYLLLTTYLRHYY